MRAFVFWVFLAFGMAVSSLSAQTLTATDYESWARTAQRAEEAIEAGRASDTAMRGLRAELAKWRTRFTEAQSLNAKTIQSVEAQIKALGPPPEEGSEPEDIATQRQQLNTRLAELTAPGKTAEVAYSRATTLIFAIDDILRERETEALLERGPSPLNPALWARGWSSLVQSLLSTRSELANAWRNPNQRAEFQDSLPTILFLVSIGLVLLLLGRRWVQTLTLRVQSGGTTPARWLAGFALSLGQVAVPLVGLYAIVQAGYATGLIGLRIDPLLAATLNAGAAILIAMWLGVRVFPKVVTVPHTMHLAPEKLREGRVVTGLVGLVLAANEILRAFARYDSWSQEARAAVFFPLIVFGGVLIWRLGTLLRANARTKQQEAEGHDEALSYSDRLFWLLGQGLNAMAFVAPLLAAAGYFRASQRATFALMESLLLLAFLLVVQRLLAELYVLLRRREEAREGLVPVLAGMGLILLAAPQFALIWGVSETQLDDLRLRAMEGLRIGESTITPGDFLTFALVFVIGYTITRLLQGALKNTVLPKTKMDSGAQNALVSGVGYVGIFLAALVAITTAGIDLSSLAIVAGALSVGIGFGLQNIVSNFVSGIILLIERPISEGDWIEVGGEMGYVRDISVRSTRIETFDRTDVIVPNADLVSGRVTNFTRGNTVGRVIVPVGVAYGTDTRKVEAILREIAEAHPMVLMHPPPNVVFQGFGADSLDFEIRAILRDVNWVLSVKSDMNHEIARRFIEEDIEIPFAQRDIWLRNPEALTAGVTPKPGAAKAETPTGIGTGQLSESDFAAGESDSEGGER
ncbi:DUF3772 domain-containing protein [Marimonas arenosa]|uniref:DUF3772 domain-containing protein n=1 Tax=Marimonas arenosa TaxID=1795305 RepID=A0AAE3WAM4_9RHOB|nr:DUF3772 domain-containing protein [Marimonas arenosa]MDQ2088988.1 DUF3772 domain-containing protein [Marimonas arenosa]